MRRTSVGEPSEAQRANEGELTVAPATPERWADIEDLFGPKGACDGCWCMYWRLPRKEFGGAGRGPRNHASFRKLVETGPVRGVLCYRDGLPLGWCLVAPRAELPTLDRSRVLYPVDDRPVWAMPCFYVRVGHRQQGVTSALIDGAVALARQNGAAALEAYPWDLIEKRPTATIFTGTIGPFVRRGFVEVARRKAERPIMRLAL